MQNKTIPLWVVGLAVLLSAVDAKADMGLADDVDVLNQRRVIEQIEKNLCPRRAAALCLREQLVVGRQTEAFYRLWKATSSDETILQAFVSHDGVDRVTLVCRRPGIVRLDLVDDQTPQRSWSVEARCWDLASVQGPSTIELNVGDERLVKYVPLDSAGRVVPDFLMFPNTDSGYSASWEIIDADSTGLTVRVVALSPGQRILSFKGKEVTIRVKETETVRSPEWEKGLAAYRKKNYTRACTEFAHAAKKEPENGAIWADLGLCEQRRGHSNAAKEAAQKAIRYGNRQVRKNAYFNLYQMGIVIPDNAVLAKSMPLGCNQPIDVLPNPRNGGGVDAVVCKGKCSDYPPNATENLPTITLEAGMMGTCVDEDGEGKCWGVTGRCVIVAVDGCANQGSGVVGFVCAGNDWPSQKEKECGVLGCKVEVGEIRL